ncbi:MAG: PSD1 and planctomycete cytochrome C domain-containing protein [Gemmataceae bacterium]
MMMLRSMIISAFVLTRLVVGAGGAEPSAAEIDFFERKVRPVLAQQCYECHSTQAKKVRAGLLLDSRAGMLQGGDSGPALAPGKPEASLLIAAINHQQFEMPPRGKLPAAQIADLTQWVAMGAPWPKEAAPTAVATGTDFDWQKRKAEHWSWQPIRATPPPAVKRQQWPSNAIDHFILAQLEDKGLTPADDADRRTLIRRLYFDLIGLPPTPRQVQDFVHDSDPHAYEKLVEELLASPHFGEKWARHWLDVVRYAETYGHEFDYPIAHAYRYRDYLIRAFNADVPYSQLMLEHVAGDLLPQPRRHPNEGFPESIIGTGFWYFGEATHAPTDVRADQADRIDNQIDVFSKAFLGLTVSCARCHDHMFDPIATKDYYALFGILASSRRQEALLDPHGTIAAKAQRLRQLRQAGDTALAAGVAQWPAADETFARYLLAAQDVLTTGKQDQEALAAVAQNRQLNAERLSNWVKALSDPAAAKETHPLFAWVQLASVAGQDFAKERQRLHARLAATQQRADSFTHNSVPLANFDRMTDNFGDWFVTGAAFGDRPTSTMCWDPSAPAAGLAPPGVVHSGLLSRKLRGVLRSPTFTLSEDHIWIRMNADRATVRLIIDGYQMEPFNGLLFGSTRLDEKASATNGEYVWKRLGNPMYRGRQAYLEFIDHDDGFIAVADVRMTAGASPVDPPHPAAKQVLGDDQVTSSKDLAHAYGQFWSEALRHCRTRAATPADVALLDWALRHELFPLSCDKQLADLRRQQAEVDKDMPASIHVVAITEGTGADEHVFIRGNPRNLGERVPRRFLVAIAGAEQPAIPHGSGRWELAQRLIDPANPFPARVLVNRLWHYLFGRGIVPSVDDFGAMGLPPSHPALLDWLADDFVQHGWSIKHTLRRIVLSRTYRQASQPAAASAARAKEIDPDNTLLYGMPIRRLNAEAIRDSLLAISGRLDRTLYGPSVNVHLTPFMQGRGRPASGPLDGAGRRSLYLAVRRNFLSPLLLTFDFPVPFSTMGRRTVSNVPAQALILMNDPFVLEQSRLWAQRALQQEQTPDDRLTTLFTTAFAHPPSAEQRRRIHDFLTAQAQLYGTTPDDPRVWADLCHMMVNMKEFVFVR